MSGAQLFIREDLGLTDEQVEVLAGSMNVYMLVSILAARWTDDLLGRRGTPVLANGMLTTPHVSRFTAVPRLEPCARSRSGMISALYVDGSDPNPTENAATAASTNVTHAASVAGEVSQIGRASCRERVCQYV